MPAGGPCPLVGSQERVLVPMRAASPTPRQDAVTGPLPAHAARSLSTESRADSGEAARGKAAGVGGDQALVRGHRPVVSQRICVSVYMCFCAFTHLYML